MYPAPDALPGADAARTSVVDALWRHKWLVLGAGLVAAILGLAASFIQTSEYSASASLILTDPRAAPDNLPISQDPNRYINNQAELIGSSAVAERAAAILEGQPTAAEIERSIAVSSSNRLDLITIRAVRPRAQEAAAVANAVGQAYREIVGETIDASVEIAAAELRSSVAQLDAQIEAVDAQLATAETSEGLLAQRSALVDRRSTFQRQIGELTASAAQFGSGVQFFEEADVPLSPSSPQPVRNTAAAAIIGLLGAGAFAWWRSEKAPLAVSREHPAGVLGAPLLAVVPPPGADRVALPGTEARERYDFALSALDFALEKVGGSMVAATSARRGAGTTAVVLNLALAARTDMRRPLLVDADFRHRSLTSLAADGHAGLAEIAAGTADLDGASATVALPGGAELPLVPAGAGADSPAGFFRTADFKKAVARLRGQAELTLLDTPPVLAAAEVAVIASQVDGVVMVVPEGAPLRDLEDTRVRLELAGRPLLGYVFVERSRSDRLPAPDDA